MGFFLSEQPLFNVALPVIPPSQSLFDLFGLWSKLGLKCSVLVYVSVAAYTCTYK